MSNFNRWPPPSRPLPVKAGLTTRRSHGEIGDTWWSKRFIEILQSFGLESRLARGRVYARKGQVISLELESGEAHAIVQGSRRQPYDVVISVRQLSDHDWQQVSEAFAQKAVFVAKLLAGDMPQNIEEAFESCSLSLFPASLDDLDSSCTCPDDANPCKHIAAALYILAESFDDDPFRIFEWRGRNEEQLLSSLRQSTRNSRQVADRSLLEKYDGSIDDLMWGETDSNASVDQNLDNFWGSGADLTSLQTDIRASSYPDVLLRQLEPFSRRIGDAMLADLLAPAYRQIATAAETLFSREVN
jgi:uncharacterized Zn finger protein